MPYSEDSALTSINGKRKFPLTTPNNPMDDRGDISGRLL